MLLEFSIENYKSFKTLQVLSLQASAQREPKELPISVRRLHAPGPSGLNILKTKAIFGGNASGKSNLVMAMATFWKIIHDSLMPENVLKEEMIPYRLDRKTIGKPSYFQIIVVMNGVQYRYGFEADQERIHSEWLYVKKKAETNYFIREKQKIISYNKNSFGEIKEVLNKNNTLYKKDTLVLSVLNALSASVSSVLFSGIIHSISINSGGIFSKGYWTKLAVQQFKSDSTYQKFVRDLLQSVDDSIVGFEINEVSIEGGSETQQFDILVTKRKQGKSEVQFSLEKEEGEGTQKVFAISYALYKALRNGGAFIIDEFDARLHPLLTRKIISLFQSIYTHNEAQLVFISHDSNLLDSSLLRRDQITFVEKSKSGESEIYDLADVKGVREHDLFEKNYLKGKYGGLPYLSDFENIVANG